MKSVVRLSFVKAVVWYGLSILKAPGKSSEFHYFPFDINKPMPPGAAKLMDRLCGALEDLGVHYRITDGTVLGLYRDKRYIPHDNDLDIDVLECADPAAVHRRMRSMGMHLGRRVYRNGQLQQLAYYSDDEIIFDMAFWHREKDKVVNFEEPGYRREQPAAYFTELGSLHWSGRTYPVPADLEGWLAFRFGHDWRTPKRSKDDWKQECLDLVKL